MILYKETCFVLIDIVYSKTLNKELYTSYFYLTYFIYLYNNIVYCIFSLIDSKSCFIFSEALNVMLHLNVTLNLNTYIYSVILFALNK